MYRLTNRRQGSVAVATLYFLGWLGAPSVSAQGSPYATQEDPYVTPRKTYFTSQMFNQLVGSTYTTFSSRIVRCPDDATAGCTIRVEVSALIADVNVGESMMARVLVDGSTYGIEPCASIVLSNDEDTAPGTFGATYGVRTFSVFRTNLAPNVLHEVQVQFITLRGAAWLLNRAITIDVYAQ